LSHRLRTSRRAAKLRPQRTRAVARMVRGGSIKIIVTLNFDGLVEQAIRAQQIEPTVVASPADVEGLAPLHTLDCCVIHLHGYYLNPASMLNTTSELGAYQPATVQLLQRVLQDCGLIVAGWSSVYDPALRAAIAAHYPSRFTFVWIEPRQPPIEATELRMLKKGLLLPTDADAGFGQLADAVEALNARNARHPLTVCVAVETAKRELSGRQVPIGLRHAQPGAQPIARPP
jgi:SIR2-like domain